MIEASPSQVPYPQEPQLYPGSLSFILSLSLTLLSIFTKMIEKIKEVPSEIEQIFSDYLNQYKNCRLQKVLYGLH